MRQSVEPCRRRPGREQVGRGQLANHGLRGGDLIDHQPISERGEHPGSRLIPATRQFPRDPGHELATSAADHLLQIGPPVGIEVDLEASLGEIELGPEFLGGRGRAPEALVPRLP